MDLSSLNDKQLAAVTAPLGPVLVLAGAGSGKTRVLAFRIAYLIEQGLMAPEHILALTFTNKAAKEMQSRVQKLLIGDNSKSAPKTATMPTMGTFHSVGARLLRKEIALLGYTSNFIIFDSDDQLKALREICDELGVSKKFPPNLFRAYISQAKNILQTPAEFNIGLDGNMHDMAASVYTQYQNFLFRQNAVDFDDLLMLPIRIFQASPKVLDKYRNLFRYILVDEYQDTNQAQYMFLFLLAEHRNLFVVGDDAQSIYGFRGSNIANILNFENDYPETKVIKLEQNYRSTKNILAVAQKVIELNREQKPKTLWTENDLGNKIKVEEVNDSRSEAAFVARQIIKMATADSGGTGAGTGSSGLPEADQDVTYEEEEPETTSFSILDQFLKKSRLNRNPAWSLPQLPANHGPLNEFAVLYRTHAQSRELEEVLIETGIPYQIIGGVKFYERREIKDMLAYIRLVLNFRDLISLKRVINVPARGIGDKSYQTVKRFVADFADNNKTAGLEDFQKTLPQIALPPKQKDAAIKFFGLLQSANRLTGEAKLSDLLRFLLKETGMEKWLRDGTEQGEARLENVKELFNVTIKFDNSPWQEGAQQFLEEVALITEIDNLEDGKDAVTLMTLHGAKGLEFDNVFFVGLEEGLLPHSQSMLDPSELAEEIRLAYVGLTRARRNLFLLYARTRRMFGNLQANAPSRILRALPKESLQINAPTSSFIDTDGDMSYEPFDG